MLSNEQLLRYSSNLLMKEIGEAGQQRLLKSHVLIIGLGALVALPANIWRHRGWANHSGR